MKIDTGTRHVTKAGANIFLELGFSPAEAKRYQAESLKRINDTQPELLDVCELILLHPNTHKALGTTLTGKIQKAIDLELNEKTD